MRLQLLDRLLEILRVEPAIPVRLIRSGRRTIRAAGRRRDRLGSLVPIEMLSIRQQDFMYAPLMMQTRMSMQLRIRMCTMTMRIERIRRRSRRMRSLALRRLLRTRSGARAASLTTSTRSLTRILVIVVPQIDERAFPIVIEVFRTAMIRTDRSGRDAPRSGSYSRAHLLLLMLLLVMLVGLFLYRQTPIRSPILH